MTQTVEVVDEEVWEYYLYSELRKIDIRVILMRTILTKENSNGNTTTR